MTIQTVTDAIRYVGVDDNTLALFENQYPVQPMGVSYNSYVILDEKIAVIISMSSSWSKFMFIPRFPADGRIALRGIALFLEIHQYRMAFRLLVQKPL